MFKFVTLICSLAKRLDERLTDGVDQHGRYLAGLKPAATAQRAGQRKATRPRAQSKIVRAGRPPPPFGRLSGLAR